MEGKGEKEEEGAKEDNEGRGGEGVTRAWRSPTSCCNASLSPMACAPVALCSDKSEPGRISY